MEDTLQDWEVGLDDIPEDPALIQDLDTLDIPADVEEEIEGNVDAYIDSFIEGLRAHIEQEDGTGEKVAKRGRVPELARSTPGIKRATQQIQSHIANFFRETAGALARVVETRKVAKADDDDVDDIESLLRLLTPNWKRLYDDLEAEFAEVAQEGGRNALLQVGVSDSDVISHVNEVAGRWARDRAAEMVGMRRQEDGTLVENPDARWAISDTTRDDLRAIVEAAFENRTTIKELAEEIRDAGTFSESRAEMIARTEASRAETQGNLEGWRGSGIIETVNVVLSADHDLEDECDEMADGGPYAIDDLEDVPPFHPNCFCSLTIGELSDDMAA